MSFLHNLHLALFSSFAIANQDLNWSSSSQLALNKVLFFILIIFNQNDTKLIQVIPIHVANYGNRMKCKLFLSRKANSVN